MYYACHILACIAGTLLPKEATLAASQLTLPSSQHVSRLLGITARGTALA
jgi:hypothetical protein